MPMLRIELQLPRGFWLGRLSRLFPDRLFWVLALQRGHGDASLMHVLCRGVPDGQVPRALRADEDVASIRFLDRRRSETILAVRYHRPVLIRALEETGLLPRLPFAVRNGRAYWEILGIEASHRHAVDFLEGQFPGSRVRAIFPVPARDLPAGLTARQERVLRAAVARGYYAYPRRIRLSELAREIGVDKGSLSVMLARISSRVVKHWFATMGLPEPWFPSPGLALEAT